MGHGEGDTQRRTKTEREGGKKRERAGEIGTRIDDVECRD